MSPRIPATKRAPMSEAPNAYAIAEAFDNVQDDLRSWHRAPPDYRWREGERLEKSFSDLARLMRQVPDVEMPK